jgi:protein ImuA
MRWVTAHRRQLLIQEKRAAIAWPLRSLGFEESITNRAVHELLFRPSPGGTLPLFPALLAARAAVTRTMEPSGWSSGAPRTLVWVDPAGTFYPPAVAGLGMSPGQVCVLRPPRAADVVWAAIECLRCPSVGAVVALVAQRLTRVEVRRLQLAAERGSGVGLLLRPHLAGAGPEVYAAATRWMVAPAPGERTIQRWRLQFIHGYGGHVGQSFLLEKHRASGQTNLVRLPPPLARHPLPAPAAAVAS